MKAFDFITDHSMWSVFHERGCNYFNYISVFRWLWNEKQICPQITTFTNEKRTRIGFYDETIKNTYYMYCADFDEVVVKTVEFVYKNIDKYLPQKEDE